MSTTYEHQVNQINGRLDKMIDITGRTNVAAKLIGNELEEQKVMIGDINTSMDTANAKVGTANQKIEQVSKMTAGNWVGWVLALLFLIGTILVWVLL
jgi:methyl-accepting chemotaxis protein